MADDPLTAFLADVRMQAEDHKLVPAHMVLPLLAAVGAVLKLTDEFDVVPPHFLDDVTAARRGVALRFREAVTATLTGPQPGEEAGDD